MLKKSVSKILMFLFVLVTAYSSVETCPDNNCVMASGKQAYVGAVACPRNIKLGTKVEMFGLVFTCEDRTAKRYDGRFDIFFGYGDRAHTQAINFGIKKLNVKIL